MQNQIIYCKHHTSKMTKDIFLRYVLNPRQFDLQDKLDIHTEKMGYPFCSILQVLDLLSECATNDTPDQQKLLRTAMQVPDPQLLNKLVAEVERAAEDTSVEARHLKEKIEAAKNKEMGFTASGDIDILDEINSFQDVSFKTAPKSVILEKFLGVTQKNEPQKQPQKQLSIDELGKKSNSEDSSLVSETLAVILEKQGKIEKSIEMYQKLIIKYPEKNRIFALRISELKNKLETK